MHGLLCSRRCRRLSGWSTVLCTGYLGCRYQRYGRARHVFLLRWLRPTTTMGFCFWPKKGRELCSECSLRSRRAALHSWACDISLAASPSQLATPSCCLALISHLEAHRHQTLDQHRLDFLPSLFLQPFFLAQSPIKGSFRKAYRNLDIVSPGPCAHLPTKPTSRLFLLGLLSHGPARRSKF